MDHSEGLGKFVFNGAIRNQIAYDKEQERWNIIDLITEKPVASRNESKSKPPIGTHSWFDHSGKEVQLSLSTCGPGEFSCSNGLCVPLSSRCDNQLTCPEGEDESQCEVVELSSSYLKDLPPLSTVSLAIQIIQIVETKEQENTITLMFELVLTWRDARLKFLNLKEEPVKNIVSQKEVSHIWIPKMDVQNMLDNVKRDEALVTVVKNEEILEERTRSRGLVRDYIYEGSEHILREEYRQTAKLFCTFNLADYPFDRQTCRMGLALVGPASISMKLVANSANILRERNVDLMQYNVEGVTIEEVEQTNLKGVLVSINLVRSIDGLLITTYLPTVMMNMINQATMYIDRKRYFETIMTTNITCMTVLASLYILFSSVVPQTSYIKSVDLWFLFNLIYPFTLILLHILIQNLKTEKELKSKTKVLNVRVGPQGKSLIENLMMSGGHLFLEGKEKIFFFRKHRCG